MSGHPMNPCDRCAGLEAALEDTKSILEGERILRKSRESELSSLKRGPDDEAVRAALEWAEGTCDCHGAYACACPDTKSRVLAAACRKAWARVKELEQTIGMYEADGPRTVLRIRAEKAEARVKEVEADLRLQEEAGRQQWELTMEARKECEEQARLNGMGGSRELALRAELAEAVKQCAINADQHIELQEKNLELQSEVERLRAAHDQLREDVHDWMQAHPCCDYHVDNFSESCGSPDDNFKALSPKPCAECMGKGDVHSHMLDLGLGDGPEEVRKPCSKCQPPKPDEGEDDGWYRSEYGENRATIERMEKRIADLIDQLAARDEAIVKPWREAVEESERVLEVVNDVLDKKGYQRMVSIDMTIGKLRALLTVKEAS